MFLPLPGKRKRKRKYREWFTLVILTQGGNSSFYPLSKDDQRLFVEDPSFSTLLLCDDYNRLSFHWTQAQDFQRAAHK
jgi:hypothetical protein